MLTLIRLSACYVLALVLTLMLLGVLMFTQQFAVIDIGVLIIFAGIVTDMPGGFRDSWNTKEQYGGFFGFLNIWSRRKVRTRE